MGQARHLASQAAPTRTPEEAVDKGEVHVISQQCPLVQTSEGEQKKYSSPLLLNMLLFFVVKYKVHHFNVLHVYGYCIFVKISTIFIHLWLPKAHILSRLYFLWFNFLSF
jgi:hypothetical protein